MPSGSPLPLDSPSCLPLPSGEAGAGALTVAAPQEPLTATPGPLRVRRPKPHGKGSLMESRCKGLVGREHLKAALNSAGEGEAAPPPPRPYSC